MTIQTQALKELATRKLEERYAPQRDSLHSFLLWYRETEKKLKLDDNRHIRLICEKLEDVFYGRVKRLMINVPPRSLKTEIVSRIFPARAMGKQPSMKFMGISYASSLAQDNSMDCRNIYNSETYLKAFPRRPLLRDDLNTKTHRENIEGGQYYASGSTGALTGKGANCIIIDDPLKPNEADSEIVRLRVNRNYSDTIKSRLNDKTEGSIVVIMQRLHDDDLCGMLLEQEKNGTGEEREKVIIKSIADEPDEYRDIGESFFPKRFPIEFLHKERSRDPQTFSTQMQQEPVSKESQEFHQERYKYHGKELETPQNLRIFTVVDPAFKTKQVNDQTAIITGGFLNDKLYLLEITAGRYTADVMQEKIIYHIQKRQPEKVGIEAYQAQSMINTFLINELQKRRLYCSIEEISQTGDKLTKIRKLIPLYRNGQIYHKYGMEELEYQLERFPRGKHDDIIDALQMLYNMYELQPNNGIPTANIGIKRDINGNPIY